MKDYYNKKEAIEVPVPLPKRYTPAATSATIDAMLDKMASLIRQRNAAWELAQYLMSNYDYDPADEIFDELLTAATPNQIDDENEEAKP
jgi:hypothetical protein